MNLSKKVREGLPYQFSIFQFMDLLGIDAIEVRKARNLLKQLYIEGVVRRIGKNMYIKLYKS